MVFHWGLNDCKSPQVSRTLLCILTVLNNVVVWMVSKRLPTSKSSTPFNNPWVTVPKAPVTIAIIVTFMFDSFFNCRAKSWYLSSFSHAFSFILLSARTAKSTKLQVHFFYWFSSLSPHSLHLLFCWILSVLTLIWLVLMALFFVTIWRDSVMHGH